MPLNSVLIWNRMLLFYIIFGDRNPPYPAGSNIPSARRQGQRFHFLQCRGSSPSLLFVNRHGGTLRRAGWVSFHQNIFTRKVTDIAFTSDFCNNYSHSASPASCIWRPRVPVPHFPASHTWCPQVPSLASPSPKSQVPTHASRCPRPLLYTAGEYGWLVMYATQSQEGHGIVA